MSGLVLGAMIVVFTALQAGTALHRVLGREPGRIWALGWPALLGLVAAAGLAAAVGRSSLIPPDQQTTALIAAIAGTTLICGGALLHALITLARQPR